MSISNCHKNLVDVVLANSVSGDFGYARNEWEAIAVDDLGAEYGDTKCVCGHPGIRWCYMLRNRLNGKVLYPVGSKCIRQFDRPELDRKARRLKRQTQQGHRPSDPMSPDNTESPQR